MFRRKTNDGRQDGDHRVFWHRRYVDGRGNTRNRRRAMGLDVDLFVTFWDLDAFRKDVARSNTKISADFAEFRDVMMERMEEKKVPHWLDVLEQAREIGNVRVRACSQTMELFGWTLDDLEPIVEDVTGVAVFVDEANDADIQLFISCANAARM